MKGGLPKRSRSNLFGRGGISLFSGVLLGFVALLCLLEHNTPRRMKSGIVIGMMASMFLNVGRIGAAADDRDAMRAAGGDVRGAGARDGHLIFSDRRRLLWWL